MLDLIVNHEAERELVTTNPWKITRDVRSRQIYSRAESKVYKIHFDKRVVDHNTKITYPYGY